MGYSKEMHIAMQEELASTIYKAEQGELNHLDALLELRRHRDQMEDSLAIIKEFERDNIDAITNEAEKFPEGYQGYKVEVRSGRKMYDFKHIPEWQDAENHKKEVEEKYRAAFVAKQKGMAYAGVSEDGEELPMPELKFGSSSIVVKKMKDR